MMKKILACYLFLALAFGEAKNTFSYSVDTGSDNFVIDTSGIFDLIYGYTYVGTER